MIIFGEKVELHKTEQIEELTGKLEFNNVDDKLMHSVLENDQETIDEGKLIRDSLNQGLSSFTPDLLFENLVKNYKLTKNLFGETLLREITGYDPSYLERNIKIPEFQKELKQRIAQRLEHLKEEGLLDSEYSITEKGVELASLIMYVEELDNIIPKGTMGEKIHKKSYIYGEKGDAKEFKKGDRYRDIAVKRSVKTAVRRQHSSLHPHDLQVFERKSKGQVFIVYALDASGSMKGKKIETAKKAGIALAHKAIYNRDKVGLVVFGSEVKQFIEPTNDFTRLLKQMTEVRASMQTDFVGSIRKAIELFPNGNITKHLILLTDALPTVGKEPEKETLEAVSEARSAGITISLIGISLDEKGREMAEKIAELGQGKLYVAKQLEDVDKIILEDYRQII